MKHLFSLLFASLISFIGIAQCEDFEMTLDYTHPSCPGFADGSVSPVISGGTAPIDVEISDSDGNVYLELEPANSLVEGWYYVYVIDAIGCELYDSVELKDPLPMVIEEMTLVDPTAFEICDGSITINEVSGDYESIYYFWSPDPDGVSGLEANVLTGACDGSYTLTLNNEIGCSVMSGDLVIGEGLGIGEKSIENEVKIIQNGNQITFKNGSTS